MTAAVHAALPTTDDALEPFTDERPARFGDFWWKALAIWTAVGLFESLQAYAQGPPPGLERSFVRSLLNNLPWWLVWFAITPIIFRLAQRFPLGRERVWQHLSIHFVAGVVLAVFHIWTAAAVLFPFLPAGHPAPSPHAFAKVLFQSYLAVETTTYWAVIAVFHAVFYQRSVRHFERSAERLATRNAQLERDVSAARLEALRMELNPHFLFNALNSVAGLVRTGARDQAVATLAQLGDLLRATLQSSHAPITALRSEVELLQQYLAIESVRFHDRLEVHFDIAPGTLEASVPCLILQPLVENAVRHGIAREPGGGTIHILATHVSESLVLTVENRSTTGRARLPAPHGSGVGLSNTRTRLAEMYGTTAAVLVQELSDGFRVTLQLPFTPVPLNVHGD
jgi:hypothetical protein